jgi:alpha-D-xyloside xylohydrolase
MNQPTLTHDIGDVRAEFLDASAVRITHRTAAGFPPARPWLDHVLLPQPGVSPESARLVVAVEGRRVAVRTHAGVLVLAESQPPCIDADGSITLSLSLEGGEGLYGWGEWFNSFQRTHGRVRLEAKDSLAWVQWRQTYSGIPFFLSSRGYGFFLLNSYPSDWRIASAHGTLEIHAAGPPADYIVIYGPAFRDILATYTALTGRPPLPPRWAFGLWVTGYPQEHQDIVLARAEEHRRRDIPLDGVILDYHWEAGFHTFNWRRALFPDPQQLIASLQRLGVRLGLIFTPFVNNRNHPFQRAALNFIFHNTPKGQEHADERALPQYEEARVSGYLAHEQVWWWLGSGGMIDFTNPAAADWWNARLRPLYEQGVAFFKNDDGEYLPPDARSHLGMDGREYHNLYGFFYGKAIFEGMAALDDRRPLIYARSVWAGSQRYPAIFLGDQHPTFGHIRSTMRAGLNMGLLGFAYWTADVFGLDRKTTPETHMRYAQWALLAPIARYFWRPPEIDHTRLPWAHGPDTEANFRAYAQLRYRLLPYFYALAWESYRTGLPLVRPLVLEFQNDPRLATVCDQVMLGDRLMLAPVVRPRARSRRIRLPAGIWHDFWSDRSYSGAGTITYAAPPDRLPILARGGTILPLGPPLSHISDDHRFGQLQLYIWPPFPAECVVYDDDGCTRSYQQGAFSATHIVAAGDQRHVVVRVAAAEGGFPSQVAERQVEIVLCRVGAPVAVRVNGRALTQWQHDAARSCVSIPISCPIDVETVTEIDFAET